MIKAIATGYRLLFCTEKGGVVICHEINSKATIVCGRVYKEW